MSNHTNAPPSMAVSDAFATEEQRELEFPTCVETQRNSLDVAASGEKQEMQCKSPASDEGGNQKMLSEPAPKFEPKESGPTEEPERVIR